MYNCTSQIVCECMCACIHKGPHENYGSNVVCSMADVFLCCSHVIACYELYLPVIM